MPRWTQTWLSGTGALRPQDDGSWPGRRFGLPPEGPAAAASSGARAAGFLVDVLVGALLGGLVNAVVSDPDPLMRSLAANGAFALQYVVLTALTGQTIGMRLIGLRVVNLRGPDRPPGFLPAAVRTALVMLLVPALITDRDRRGLHDKAAGTVVVTTR